jgi:hypothetical protein
MAAEGTRIETKVTGHAFRFCLGMAAEGTRIETKVTGHAFRFCLGMAASDEISIHES